MYSFSPILTLIGLSSFTLTVNLYSLGVPVSLVTVIINKLAPSFTSFLPVPAIEAYPLAGLPVIVTSLTVDGTSTLYSKVSAEKAGVIL